MKTMNQLIDEYVADMETDPMRPSTKYQFSYCVKKYIAPKVGLLPIIADDSDVVDRLIRKVADNVGLSVARCCSLTLRQMFKMAIRGGNIAISPMVGPSADLWRPASRQVLDAGRYADLRKGIIAWESAPSLDMPRNQELHEVTDYRFHTGLRPNELIALRWSDVDLVVDPPTVFINATVSRTSNGRAIIHDHPKTRRDLHHVTIPAFIAAQLQERHARQTAVAMPNPLNLVFPSPIGTAWDSNRMSKTLGAVAGSLGYIPVSLLTLRQCGTGQ